jgi:hypothetical protein
MITITGNENDIIFYNGNYFVFENNDWQAYSKVNLIRKLGLPVYTNLIGAYKLTENTFEINVDDAKEFQIMRFREARTPILQSLDIDYLKADEKGDSQLKLEIATKKNALRDVTKISLPDNLNDLNNFWPDILN